MNAARTTFTATPSTLGQTLRAAREATPPTDEEVAARIPRWRSLPHVSQGELAARCDSHQPTLANRYITRIARVVGLVETV